MAEVRDAVLIVTPLPLEFRAMRAHLEDASPDYHPKGTYFIVGRIPGVPGPVVLVSPGDGNLNTAVLVERGIERYRPRALLLVGIAGSLKTDVEIGDVVVSTWVHAIHGGKEDDSGFSSRPRSRAAAHRFSQVAVAVSLEDGWSARLPSLRGRRPQVHHKPIAAGEVVLNSRDSPLAQQIKRYDNDAVAIEMESAGSAAAAHLNDDLPTLTIRGISDLADGQKHLSDQDGLQPAAAERAAAFAVAFLRELPKAEAVVNNGAAQRSEPAAGRAATPTAWRPLGADLPVTWLSDLDRSAPDVLEVHLVPVGRADRLEMRNLDHLGAELARLAREHALVSPTEALHTFATTAPACSGVASTDQRSAAGLAVTRSGQRSVWSALCQDRPGSALDEDDLTDRLTTMIRLLMRIPTEPPEEAGFALGVGTGTKSFDTRTGPIRVAARDATRTADLARRAPTVARDLAARLLAEFRSGSFTAH